MKKLCEYCYLQGLVKGEKLCFRNLDFYFQHGESTPTANQVTSPASKKSQDINKVSLLLQDLDKSQNHCRYRALADPISVYNRSMVCDIEMPRFDCMREFPVY